jgi:hypothetical protein
VPFHTAQLALSGLGEDAIRDASWAAQMTVGLSSYFYGTGYDQDQFKVDLDRIIKHIQESAEE